MCSALTGQRLVNGDSLPGNCGLGGGPDNAALESGKKLPHSKE